MLPEIFNAKPIQEYQENISQHLRGFKPGPLPRCCMKIGDFSSIHEGTSFMLNYQ